MTDWILRGGEVVDGSGGPRRRADVAIAGDRIAAVGEVAKADGGARDRRVGPDRRSRLYRRAHA